MYADPGRRSAHPDLGGQLGRRQPASLLN
jgi:hypothetical protein